MPKLFYPKSWWENPIVLSRFEDVAYTIYMIFVGGSFLLTFAPSWLIAWMAPSSLLAWMVPSFLFLLPFYFIIYVIWLHNIRQWRMMHIRAYEWPPGLLERFGKHYPSLTQEDKELVSQGLRQFFLAYLNGGERFFPMPSRVLNGRERYFPMPSRVADHLWREFILDAHAYQEFCQDAFGEFLHHRPAIAFTPDRTQDYEGLCWVWDISCSREDIDPRKAERLPLLFALDKRLNISHGFHYEPDCQVLREAGEEAFRQYTA